MPYSLHFPGTFTSPEYLPVPGIIEYGNAVYAFFIGGGSSNDLVYQKSSDGGRTWGSPVTIDSGSHQQACVWFDRWTPGDTGTIVHIVCVETGADDVLYYSLDVATDTIGNGGTPTTVFGGATASLIGGPELAITKARGGNLYVAYDIDAGTEFGFARSTDAGATWGSRATVMEGGDYCLLVPGNEADNQDIWGVYWDRSANELSLKTYDDSGDSWAEQSIAGTMADQASATVQRQFAVAVRASDNHALVAAWDLYDNASSRLRTWDINGAASITAKTDIHTNVDDCIGVALSIVPEDEVIATYLGKGDGSETANTALGVYRKHSLDGMVTWGSEEPLLDLFTFPAKGVSTPLNTARRNPRAMVFGDAVATFGSATDLIFVASAAEGVRAASQIGI